MEAELQQMTAVAKESTDRAEHLELQIGIYKNVMRKDINSIGASLAQYGMPEETCFHDKDVGNLIATAVEDVHKYLVQLRSNNTKAKQRYAHFPRCGVSRWNPEGKFCAVLLLLREHS